jgi:NADH:ubiquinone oxidoreductase subunit 3 (subunit A)
MPYQGLGFAIILGVGLATAIFYIITQAILEPAHNNNNNKPPFDRGPNNDSWHTG